MSSKIVEKMPVYTDMREVKHDIKLHTVAFSDNHWNRLGRIIMNNPPRIILVDDKHIPPEHIQLIY